LDDQCILIVLANHDFKLLAILLHQSGQDFLEIDDVFIHRDQDTKLTLWIHSWETYFLIDVISKVRRDVVE
jgi:hypothetical protein